LSGTRCGGAALACVIRVRRGLGKAAISNGCSGRSKIVSGDYVIRDECHLRIAVLAFQLSYNVTRPHQHLCGQTPQQAWLDIDPLKTAPRSVLAFNAWGGRLRGIVLRH